MYDNLVPKEVLKEVPGKAEVIYVGKRAGRHFLPQEDINRLLVEKAKEGKVVVRLKGGDPLIFGRAAEEIKALEDEGIDYEVIPGVTAASAACAKAKISLTSRECASVLSFITGHRRRGEPLELPFGELASLGGTIVVYMGVSTAEEIAGRLTEHGLSDETPVLIACSVGFEEERFIKTTLGELPKVKREKKIEPPALLVIGRVVNGCL